MPELNLYQKLSDIQLRLKAPKNQYNSFGKYNTKGQRIALTGSVRTGSYTDRNGIKHYTFDVWANNVEFCESKSNSAPMQNTQPVSRPTDNGNFSEMPSEEDLPF